MVRDSDLERIKNKLNTITDIWNDYILEYKICNSHIKFTFDVKSNYYGEILHYFIDTFPLIYQVKQTADFTQNIGSSIVLLQTIYVQQDLIEEMLHILQCNISKGDLKKDVNYIINREIRNELLGHPIRKDKLKGKMQLISSTMFSNLLNEQNIAYLKYHIDNNYKFEHITHNREDIIIRHSNLLNTYFDMMLVKLKRVLAKFKKQIQSLENCIGKASFAKVVELVSNKFESFYRGSVIYKPENLNKAYELKAVHERYKNVVDSFYTHLKESLRETQSLIDRHIDSKKDNNVDNKIGASQQKVIVTIKKTNSEFETKKSYHYPLEKLSNKSVEPNFRLGAAILRNDFNDNKIVMNELDNMEMNYDNDFEYYCSYWLIRSILI